MVAILLIRRNEHTASCRTTDYQKHIIVSHLRSSLYRMFYKAAINLSQTF